MRHGDADPPFPAVAVAGPVTRVRLANGEQVWLVTRYDDVRTMLGDPVFSAAGDPMHRATPGADAPFIGRLPHTDPPDHSRYRRPLGRAFTPRRVAAWQPAIARAVDDRLDAMADLGPPVDLIESLAVPVPLSVIGTMMDLPRHDWPALRKAATDLLSDSPDREHAAATNDWLLGYLRTLVTERRIKRGSDLLSELIEHSDLGDTEIADLGATLVLGGFDSLAASIGTAVALLLCHPDRPRTLAAADERLDPLVEETLRFTTIVQRGVDRTAVADCRLGDADIRAGDRVVADLPAANRDQERWAEADTYDPTRPALTNVAFGHGPHLCVGMHLARVELRVVLDRLLTRFPALELAVPADRLVLCRDRTFAGLRELPVAW
ncbi:cytochrome P450 [Amycolatopsis thailandensis]|uniref:Cytochrome P450 n=1 Tax=Amycolatopsis thailandensis TaxID=589330 RepID=A0A229RHM6_9PSEU|nr:cytochrome P450 [Amycolatopsis thailandensis]OXM45989.1 cytochrome P450 [Amycolatopsis thailandensis]